MFDICSLFLLFTTASLKFVETNCLRQYLDGWHFFSILWITKNHKLGSKCFDFWPLGMPRLCQFNWSFKNFPVFAKGFSKDPKVLPQSFYHFKQAPTLINFTAVYGLQKSFSTSPASPNLFRKINWTIFSCRRNPQTEKLVFTDGR